MTLIRANAGGWIDGQKLTSAQANTMDINAASGVDSVAGGTYAPSGSISIAGTNGLVISGSGVGARLRYASQSMSRRQDMTGFNSSGNWARAVGNLGWVCTTTTSSLLTIHLDRMPDGATLNSVNVYYEGAAGHVGAPANLPTLSIFRVGVNGASVQLGSTATDTYGTAGAFQTAHAITVSSIATAIDRTNYSYVAQVISESGANSVANASVTSCAATFTLTNQDPGG